MRIYKAVFKPISPITELPSAQTLFGAFCQQILQTKGEKELDQYLDSFQEDPWFVHSSMFPDSLFPAPKVNLLSTVKVNQQYGLALDRSIMAQILSDMKKYKKMKFISEKIYRKYMLTDSAAGLGADLIIHSEWFNNPQKTEGESYLCSKDETIFYRGRTIQMIRNGSRMNETEKELFYQKQTYLDAESRTAVYIKSNLSENDLKHILRTLEIQGAGTRRTVGLNLFQLISLEEICWESKTDKAYLLSECIPAEDEFDLDASSYSIRSSLFRASKSYLGDTYVGRFNAFEPGSVMTVHKKKEFYGSIFPVIKKGKPVFHYGIGFVL